MILFFLLLTSQVQAQKIVASDRAQGDCYGWSTAIYKNYAVVGVPLKNKNSLWQVGAAYILQDTPSGWKQVQKLESPDTISFNFFGTSVDISANYAIVGADGDDDGEKDITTSIRKGAAYVYKKTGSKWILSQKLRLANRDTTDLFGHKVKISDQYAVVSAPGKNTVYIYGNTAGKWELFHQISSSLPAFGKAIALYENKILISSDISIFIYDMNQDCKMVTELAYPSSPESGFGGSISLNKDFVIVGAEGQVAEMSEKNIGFGHAYIYQDGKLKQTLMASDKKPYANFGNAVSISDSLIIVGAFGDSTTDGRYAGAAYIFKLKDGMWKVSKKITANPRSKWDKFGFSVAAYKNEFIIGSRFEGQDAQEKNTVLYAGAVYIYRK